jgi:antitoxin (DNA-binding transcriptional repressor) of toxin-antitoxin stability system
MKTLTVQEASLRLGEWLRRAVNGEQIAIDDGGCAVLLQPLAKAQKAANELSPRVALRQLQSRSRVSAAQAADYLREVRAERLAERASNA